jgi:hypothetical protein
MEYTREEKLATMADATTLNHCITASQKSYLPTPCGSCYGRHLKNQQTLALRLSPVRPIHDATWTRLAGGIGWQAGLIVQSTHEEEIASWAR